jgi:hypothetical protein
MLQIFAKKTRNINIPSRIFHTSPTWQQRPFDGRVEERSGQIQMRPENLDVGVIRDLDVFHKGLQRTNHSLNGQDMTGL